MCTLFAAMIAPLPPIALWFVLRGRPIGEIDILLFCVYYVLNLFVGGISAIALAAIRRFPSIHFPFVAAFVAFCVSIAVIPYRGRFLQNPSSIFNEPFLGFSTLVAFVNAFVFWIIVTGFCRRKIKKEN